jgi:hypothetical protein
MPDMGAPPPEAPMPVLPKILPEDPVTPPKRRKKLPAPPRPTTGQIETWANEDEMYWQERNVRMLADQRLYELTDSTREMDFKSGLSRIIRNTPNRLVNKYSNVVGSNPPKISVPARSPESADAAERIEDFLYYWRREADLRWQAGIHSAIEFEKAHFGALRGWICGLIGNNPLDPNFPWVFSLHDPLNVYPRAGSGGLRHVMHIYTATKAQVAADYPHFADVVEDYFETKTSKGNRTAGDDDGTGTARCIAYYDSHWWALLLDSTEIVCRKHGYGFIPWVIRLVGGSATRAGEDIAPLKTENIGAGLLAPIRSSYIKQNEILTQIATEVRKSADPTVNIYYAEDKGKPTVVSTRAGGRNYWVKDEEDVKLFDLGAIPPEVQHLLNALNEDVNLAGLPPVLYGEGAPNLAGYAITLLNAATRDAFFPLTSACESFDAETYRRVLELFEEYGAGTLHFIGQREGKRSTYGNQITPEDIANNGTYVEVTFGSIMPQDVIAYGNLGTMLVREHVVDREWVQEHIGVTDTVRMQKRVKAEMVTMDEGLMKTVLIPSALAEVHPELLDFYVEMVLEGGQGAPGANGGPPGGLQPGPGNAMPGSAPVGSQPGGPEMQPGVLPPQMLAPGIPTNERGGPNPGVSPDVAAYLATLRSGGGPPG